MENNNKQTKRPLDTLVIGLILFCVILVLVEIFSNLTHELDLSILSNYV